MKIDADKVVKDSSPFIMKYDPSHPAANAQGYVKTPNVNPLLEMMDMREAQRSYEANLGVISMARSMLMSTIELLRN
jgi:flagellar basal-body rod protein FlgC